jgi:hypothetical protein
MPSQAPRATKEFHGSEFTGVRIGERQIQPGVRNTPPQTIPVLSCFTATLQFFSIILRAHSLHLPFA